MYSDLGKQGKDKITGFEGTIVGHCEYLSGCNQTLLAPKVSSDGKLEDGRWFDDQRIEVSGAAIVLDNSKTPGADAPAPIR